jgi:hypothetical protein
MADDPFDPWTDLLARHADSADTRVRLIREHVRELSKRPASMPILGDLTEVSNALVPILLGGGVETCRTAFASVAPLIERAISEETREFVDMLLIAAMGLPMLENVAHVSRHPDARAMQAATEAHLEMMSELGRDLPDDRRFTLALPMIAYEREHLVKGLAGALTIQKRFSAGSEFGHDISSFTGYLAAAVLAKAPRASITPAWIDFLRYLPHRLAIEAVEWSTLLYAARIVHDRFPVPGEKPLGEWLYDQVRQ